MRVSPIGDLMDMQTSAMEAPVSHLCANAGDEVLQGIWEEIDGRSGHGQGVAPPRTATAIAESESAMSRLQFSVDGPGHQWLAGNNPIAPPRLLHTPNSCRTDILSWCACPYAAWDG
jgi:hypothetical protein